MSNERFDLTQVEAFLEEAGPEAGGTYIYGLIAELQRCYEQIDYFVDMLHKLGYYGENISEAKQLEWDDASEWGNIDEWTYD